LAETPATVLAAVHRRMPRGAAFSGPTAAWLLGLDLPPCQPVEVTIPQRFGISALAGACVRRCALTAGEIVICRGMQTTSAVRTAVDLSRHLSLVDAVVALDMAAHQRIVDLTELRTYVASHPGAKGIARVRRVIQLAEPASESPGETRLRLLLVLNGLPRPHAQAQITDEGGRFVGRVDLYYPDHRLGLEYDGGNHRDRMIEDNRRQNRLLDSGVRLLRFTGADLRQNPGTVVHLVRGALARAG
jgi:hypothetical protein